MDMWYHFCMSKPTTEFALDTIVQVYWNDASTRGLWDTIEYYNEHKTAECISVGYLLRHTKDDILLVNTMSGDKQANGAIAIPASWVKHIEVLSRGRKPQARKRTKAQKKSK